MSTTTVFFYSIRIDLNWFFTIYSRK